MRDFPKKFLLHKLRFQVYLLETIKYISFQKHIPVGWENIKRRWFITQIVHLCHRDRYTALGHHLLVLYGRAFKSLPHVYVLKRDCTGWKRERDWLHLRSRVCKVNSSIDLLIEKRDVRTGFSLGKRDVGCATFFALFI